MEGTTKNENRRKNKTKNKKTKNISLDNVSRWNRAKRKKERKKKTHTHTHLARQRASSGKVGYGSYLYTLDMVSKDVRPFFQVGRGERKLSIEPAGPTQGGVQVSRPARERTPQEEWRDVKRMRSWSNVAVCFGASYV